MAKKEGMVFLRGRDVDNAMHTTLLHLQFLLQGKLHGEIRYIEKIQYKFQII